MLTDKNVSAISEFENNLRDLNLSIAVLAEMGIKCEVTPPSYERVETATTMGTVRREFVSSYIAMAGVAIVTV